MQTRLSEGNFNFPSNLISYSIITRPYLTNRDLKPQHFSSKEATFTRSELPYIDSERIESKP